MDIKAWTRVARVSVTRQRRHCESLNTNLIAVSCLRRVEPVSEQTLHISVVNAWLCYLAQERRIAFYSDTKFAFIFSMDGNPPEFRTAEEKPMSSHAVVWGGIVVLVAEQVLIG